MQPNALASFWKRVRKNKMNHPELGTPCWVWIGSTDKDEYGQLKAKVFGFRSAHRFSWAIHNGTIPDATCVLHRCDDPRCVNPCHLFLGTDQDNMTDKVNKGRQNKGEAQHLAKLTDAVVSEIRRRYKPRCRVNGARAMALEFQVDKGTISRILRGITWKHEAQTEIARLFRPNDEPIS